MDCDRYWELLSARLDGALDPAEEQELEEHLSACPDCRAAGAQLAALQAGFAELEEAEAPAGFARGVMGRVRAEEAEKKAIPLLKRPRFRALAGLAACAALAVGLYGAARRDAGGEDFAMMARSFSQDAAPELGGASACEVLAGDEEAPMIAAYAAPEADAADGAEAGMEKAAPNPAADGLTENRLSSLALSENTMAMDCFPEGAAELIPPETAVQPYPGGGTVYLDVPKDIYDQIEQLAVEQGMTFSCALTGDGGAEDGPFTLIILEE